MENKNVKDVTYKITIVNEQTGKVEHDLKGIETLLLLTTNGKSIDQLGIINANKKVLFEICVELEVMRRRVMKNDPLLKLADEIGLLEPEYQNDEDDCDKCDKTDCKSNPKNNDKSNKPSDDFTNFLEGLLQSLKKG